MSSVGALSAGGVRNALSWLMDKLEASVYARHLPAEVGPVEMNRSKPTAQPIKILVVAGARPNFMKIAPLMREMEQRTEFEPFLVHTGQHYDRAMSESFFEDLKIREPDVNLEVGSGSHAVQTAEILRRIEPHLVEQQPDALLVVGDVNSTIATSLAAVKLQIPVAHVEAGLRSGDRTMPEEINRILTDAIAEWLFITEPSARVNLEREGVPAEKIHFVGNVMIDTLLENLERSRKLDTLRQLGLQPGTYAVLTLHRPANVDDPETLRQLFGVLEEIHKEIPIIFPCHPRTKQAISKLLHGNAPGLRLIEPIGYLDFLRLMADAKLVLTDSGGIQEETTVLGVPCITLRENTERPVTITEGTNILTGTNPATIRAEVEKILAAKAKQGKIPEKWDGKAAERIIEILANDLSRKVSNS